MLILNLDGFKVFNDTMGTAGGDQVLQEIARRLESCCRAADTPGQTSVKMPHGEISLCRLDGDVFGVLPERVKHPSEAMRLAYRVQSELNSPLTVNGREASVAASIGIALSKATQEHAEHLLRDADDAMRRASQGIATANPDLTCSLLAQLNRVEVGTSIDDFGIAPVRLEDLRRFPVDTLKIDRSLVNNLLADRVSRDVVDLILTPALKLNKKVVAEGIEKAAQVEQLRALGCTFGQGYFFSQPLKAAQADELIREQYLSARAMRAVESK